MALTVTVSPSGMVTVVRQQASSTLYRRGISTWYLVALGTGSHSTLLTWLASYSKRTLAGAGSSFTVVVVVLAGCDSMVLTRASTSSTFFSTTVTRSTSACVVVVG